MNNTLIRMINVRVKHRTILFFSTIQDDDKVSKHNFVESKVFLGMKRTTPSEQHYPWYKTILKCTICDKNAIAQVSDWEQNIELKPTFDESKERCPGKANKTWGEAHHN